MEYKEDAERRIKALEQTVASQQTEVCAERANRCAENGAR